MNKNLQSMVIIVAIIGIVVMVVAGIVAQQSDSMDVKVDFPKGKVEVHKKEDVLKEE